MSKGMRVGDRIIEYLYKIAPDEAMPKTIARVLRLSHGTVRKELVRILARKKSPLICEHRGFYRHRLDIDVIAKLDRTKQIELHGIQLQGVCHQVNGAYSISRAAKSRYRKRGTYKEMFEDRIVTITVYEKGTVQVWLNTSTNPMSFQQFDRFQAWVKGLLDFVDERSWVLQQLGLNVDVRRLALEGVSGLKLSTFRNAWFQIYQKAEDMVRFETHMFPDLRLDEALLILKQLVELKIPPREQPYQAPSEDKGDYSYR